MSQVDLMEVADTQVWSDMTPTLTSGLCWVRCRQHVKGQDLLWPMESFIALVRDTIYCTISLPKAKFYRFYLLPFFILWLLGGYDGLNILSSVERYDPHTAHWSHVTPMATKRSGNQI